VILFLLACGGPSLLDSADLGPFFAADPVIDTIDFECDEDAEAWTFVVRTQGWTGGGWLWMGKTVADAESHKIGSVGAAADGSTDKLKLKLKISADWRDASANSSTRWLCSDLDALSMMTTVYDPKADHVVDCRAWGADTTLWLSVDGAFDCDKVWQTDTGGRTDTGGSTDTGR